MTATETHRWRVLSDAPKDIAGLAMFRILFGGLMFAATVRFVAYGWVETLYIAPSYHFTYHGFAWVHPWPAWGMYLHFAVIGIAALGIALGAFFRVSVLTFLISFTYVELIDKATYLNHYYLVSLLALLLLFTPAHRCWSIDALRRPETARSHAGAWSYDLLRAQIALVYLFAGIAKLNPDWLFEAQPLRIWLTDRTHLPWVGPWMDEVWLAYAMSWAGALYDLTIPAWLLWSRTRAAAYASVVVFHVTTWLLFPIGMFPWVMIIATTLFFAPGWPRNLIKKKSPPLYTPPRATPPVPSWSRYIIGLYLVLQVAIPLRHLAYPGQVNWTEQGFRFAWRVMLVEKTGMTEFEVQTQDPPRRWTVYPSQEPLTALQIKMMSTQPDMIQHYAHHLAARYRHEGFKGVSVRAWSWVAFNGRPSRSLINTDVDLAAEPIGLAHKPWVLPLTAPP